MASARLCSFSICRRLAGRRNADSQKSRVRDYAGRHPYYLLQCAVSRLPFACGLTGLRSEEAMKNGGAAAGNSASTLVGKSGH